MRIQHNIMAMNAYRNYNNNTSALSKNLEKLSSGYKINRAGDDAAGLAISEKMRAQITGLNAAQKNVKDGISLVKTAEGAMQEIQDMLNRMDYLATQSANGTYDDEVDRLNLQKEVSALKDEINRIADSANFNGIKLLDGDLDGGGASSRAQITLPDVGRPIGDATVLKDGGVTPGKTVFDVQFDTLAINAKAGDTLTVSIGDTDVELTLEEKQYKAEDLAKALEDAFKDANGANGKLTVGANEVDFEVKANGTSVTFTQKNDPTGADDTVPAMMDVKMTFEAAAGGGPVQLDAGVVVAAEGDTASIEGTANTEMAIGTAKASAAGLDVTEILAALDGKTIADGAKVTIEKNADSDKLELKVGDEVIATSDNAVDGNATAFKFTTDGGAEIGTITFDSAPAADDYADALDTGLSYKAAVDGTDPAPGPDGDGDEEPETELVASGAISMTGVTADTADPDATLSATDVATLKTLFGAGTTVSIDGKIDVDLSDVADNLATDGSATVADLANAILEKAKTAVDAWNKANGDAEGFTYENLRISSTNNEDGVMQLAAAGDLFVLADKTPKTADENPDMPASVSGSYNAGTVKITQGAPEVGGATASTAIDLKDIFGGDIGDGSTLTIGKETYTFKWGDSFGFSGNTITLDKNATAAERIKQAGIGMSNMKNSAFTIGNENDTGRITIDEAAGQNVYTSELYTKAGFEALFSANSVSPKTGNGLTLQIGDTADSYNQLKVSVGNMHTSALGIEGVDISNQAGASEAIQTIKDAINRVSSVRGDLGAIQNRLEHTGNNLSVMAENIQDAESTIRDTDVAEEMMSYVKNNILVQSAQAMLAQANQVPQGVLQLLG